jgi:hypothetical protein
MRGETKNREKNALAFLKRGINKEIIIETIGVTEARLNELIKEDKN